MLTTGSMRMNPAALLMAASVAMLAGCADAPRAPSGPPASDAAVAEIDALFAENGCQMTSTAVDAALASRPNRAALERALEQLLLTPGMQFTLARPAPILRSTRGACS